MANQTVTQAPTYSNGNILLTYKGGQYVVPYTGPIPPDLTSVNAKLDTIIAGLAPAPASISTPMFDNPTFVDLFRSEDLNRFIVSDPNNFPPKPGTPGRWQRTYYTGWPTFTGDQDRSARSFTSNHEAQSYEDKGVVISPDGLKLIATRDTSNHFGLPWTSGLIVQNKDLALRYGYFEMVAELPKGPGLWPAFWLLPVSGHWPPELDVMEQLGNDTTSIYCTPHGAAPYQGVSTRVSVADVSTNFHKYGLLWKPDICIWFVDDVEVTRQATPPDANEPHYMIANLAVGDTGSWPGPTDATTPDPAVMVVRSIASYALGSWSGGVIPKTPAT